jgi:hypothetical protein
MPFVTEELWQRLPRGPQQQQRQQQEQQQGGARPASIMVADYPTQQPAWEDPTVEGDMAYILTVVNRWGCCACCAMTWGSHKLSGLGGPQGEADMAYVRTVVKQLGAVGCGV